MANLENLKNGKKFKKGHPPMGGRPKNVFKQYADQFELSKTDVKNIINLVLSKNTTELEKMALDKETSALLLAFISASITAIKKGDTKMIEGMLDRSIGKVADKLNINDGEPIKIVYLDKQDDKL